MIRIKDLNDPGAREDFAAGRAVAYLATERDLEANRELVPELEKGGHVPMRLPALIVSETYYREFKGLLQAWSKKREGPRPLPEPSSPRARPGVDDAPAGGPYRSLFIAAGGAARIETVVIATCEGSCPACAANARVDEERWDQISGFGSLSNNDLELAELRAKVDVIGDIIDAAGLHNLRRR